MRAFMDYIPTPCTAKREVDDDYCFRLSKRLRLEAPAEFEKAPPLGHPLVLPQQVQTQSPPNSWLRQLHIESTARRQAAGSAAAVATPSAVGTHGGQMLSAKCAIATDVRAMTHFLLADVVQCSHGPGGRCLQCSGRLVQNVPFHMYSAFSSAYGGGSSSSSSSGPSYRSSSSSSFARSMAATMAAELSFPALTALFACLAPGPSERLLHLGSGSARAVLAWSLLLPSSIASGVEPSPELHRIALQAAFQLGQQEQRRVFLHNGDPFATQSEWRHASIIFISGTCLEDAVRERVAGSLGSVEPGTRVVTCSQPLFLDGRAPIGFTLERQAAYRSIGAGNVTVYIYRRSEAT